MATLRLLDPTAPTGRILDSRVGERDYVDAAQADAAGGNSFTNAFTGARLGNQANQLADEESVLRTSSNPADQLKADELASQRAGLKLRGQAYAPAVGRYEDVHSLSDAGSYVAGRLGQGLGSSVDQMATGAGMNALASGLQMIPTLPTRLAGTALRYAAPAEMYRQNKNLLTGEAYDSVSEDPTVMANRSAQDIRDEVSKHGYRAAVMDTLPQLLPVGQVTGTLGKVAKKVPAWGKLAGEAVGEGVTEAGQQISQHYAHEALNPNRDTSGDVSENINSALGGAIGGGGMGAIGHLGEKAWDRGRTVGDGKNGDVLNLDGTPTPGPAKPSVLETLNGRPSKFTRRAEAQKYADILSGSPADGVDANAQWMEENGPVRKSALLAELAKRKEPEAAAHAAEVSAVDDKDPMAVMDPRMDAASEWLLPKLHLTNAEVSQMKRNAERVSSTDLGSRAGAGGTAEFEKLMLPDGAREKMGDVKFAAAQAEVKAHGQTAKLLADRLWSAFGTNKEGKPNLDDRELVQGLAQEVMAAATVDKPTEEEARRAQRLGEHLVRVVGPEAVPVLQGLTRTGGSTLLDHVIARATGVASMGSGLSHKQEQLSRTEAAVAFTNLVPPTVERRLLNDHGIDLNDEKDQNDLLDLVEDFHDGRSNVTLMRLNKLLTAPVVKAMGLYLGNKIQPRLRGEEAVAQEHTSGATKTTDADTEGTSGGKLISGELMGEQSEAPSEYEAVGQEKSMDRVMPESMVFHHSGNKDGSVRDIKDAWKEDAKGELPQLLREGTGAPLLDRVKKLAQQAAAHLGNSRDRYVIGDPASKDPLVAAGATSAKKLMDDTGMPDSKRAQLLFRYLAKENKDLDVGELEDMHKSVAYLGQLDRALTSTVTNRESLSPSGEKLSIPHSAEINAPHIDYEKLADLAANPSDAAKVKELFKAGTISKYVGLAQIVRRAKAAAEQYLTTLPGYSEFVSKAEAADGRTPEFHEYVNDFFSQHHVVVAEQPTNRDHLQMSLPEFREMAMKGKANLKSAELAVVGSSMNDKARESERLRVEASMNLIRFKSSHSRSVDGEVYLPAHMLVAWVRKMRNAHETDGKNAPTKSNSPTKQTEDYKRDLMEGITTVMQNDLTDGLPWIINSTGKREDFTETALHAKPGDPTQRQLFNDGNGRNPPDHGSLPPSLDLDGITAEDADASRASGAKKRREAEEAHTASQSSLNAERGLAEEEERKNAELGQDDRDVQDADSVAAAEAEANGSKTREEERANLKFMSSVMGAAADKGPRPLTVGGAMNYAGRVADELWRSYIGGERKEALARIMSYVRATDKERYDEDASNDAHIMEGLWAEYNKAEEGSDEQDAVLKRIEEQAATTNSGKQTTTAAVGSGLVGGQQYNFPLAALLTPRHMASLNPKDVAVMTMLRSRVASELLGMFHAKQISGGNLGKLVNFLSGYTDKTSQDMLDKKNPPDADLIKNRTPWQSTRIYQAGREGFLAAMAKPYQEMVTKRGPAVAKDVLGWVGHPMIEGQAGPVHKESARALQRMEAAVEDGPGVNRDAASTSAAAVAEAKTRLQAADARTSTSIAGLNTGTEGASQDKKLSIKVKKQRRENTPANGLNESLRSIAEPLGGGRSDKSASAEEVAADTAATNESVDKLAKVIGNSLDARKATAMEQKVEATTEQPAHIKRSSEVLTEPSAEQSVKAAANPPKQLQVTAALAHFKRTLSDQVKVMFADAFPDMTHGADYNTVEHLARISTANPLKIMQLAYHESMHGFFDTVLNAKGHEEIKAMMQGAMSEPKVYARLKDMLRDSPDALADMERDPEERVAYAYQFWAAGMLSIAQTPTTVFQKVQALMRRVFNAVSDNEKALAMFEAFHKGELKEPSAAGKAMLKIMQTGEWKAQFMKRFDKQVQAVYAEVMANHLVGRNSESATARKINNMWYSNPAYGSDTAEDGVINRTQMMRKKYINRLRLALAPLKGPNADRDLKALGEALNAHTTPELAHVAKAKVAVQALLKQYHAYAREAGIDLGERFGTDGDNDYFTRVMDLEKLINGKEEFTSMLMMKYPHVLKPAIGLLQRTAPEGSKITEIDVANAIHQMYIDHNGVDDDKLSAMREDGILNPFFAAQNKRELYWIKDADIAPFLNTDAVGTLTQYISQGVRAAEYARAFGQGGADLKDMMAREGDVQTVDKDGVPTLYTEDGPVASELVAAAEKQGLKGKPAEEWVNRRVDDLRRSHGAYEGSLGKDITAEIRKLQAGAMIYQTLRLLPLMIFSSMLDPNGIRVAGGTSDDMFDAYKRGFSGLWMNWKDMFLGNAFGSRDPDAKEMAALEAGVIDSDMELEEMGQVHSSEYSSGITRHIGHAFFKAIGITQWDRDMRISAVDAARKSIVSSFNNEVPEHSPRWLKEIGLKRDQVFINAGGDLIVSARELALKNSISRAEAAKLLEPTHLAINRWVNRAIVSPNAGLRPTRFSDPHFAMFAQFKSFTYAFQETTLRYAAHEAEQGNFNSGAQLLRGIPIMIAADMTKAMLTGGGSLPGYMANWTMADWVSHAINRSGVGGTGTFATDILSGDIVGTLAGPTVDHAVGTVGKLATGEVGSAITNSIPIVKQLAGGAKHVAAAAI